MGNTKYTIENLREKLSEVCEDYRQEKFIVKKRINRLILCEDRYGEFLMTYKDILSLITSKRRVGSSENEKMFIYNIISERNPEISEQINSVLKYENGLCFLDTIHGIMRMKLSKLKVLKKFVIGSASDKTDFWLRKNKDCRKDWDNIDYSKFTYSTSTTKSIFRCKIHDMTYLQSPDRHINNKQSCPKCMPGTITYTEETICTHKEYLSKIEGYTYILRLSNNSESFYKIGVTSKSRINYRTNSFKKSYNVELLYSEPNNMVECYKLEQRFLKEFSNYKYEPKIHFKGHTECLTINPVECYYHDYYIKQDYNEQ